MVPGKAHFCIRKRGSKRVNLPIYAFRRHESLGFAVAFRSRVASPKRGSQLMGVRDSAGRGRGRDRERARGRQAAAPSPPPPPDVGDGAILPSPTTAARPPACHPACPQRSEGCGVEESQSLSTVGRAYIAYNRPVNFPELPRSLSILCPVALLAS